jgi:hypothetical protein
MRMSSVKMAILATACAVVSSPALAAGPGDTVTCQVTGTGTFVCSSASTTITAGQEFTAGISGSTQFIGINFGTNTLSLSALSAGSLSGTILNFTDTTNPFATFSLTSNNGWNGFNVANSSLTNGVLSIDLRGTDFSQGANLNFALTSVRGAVPEPATWAMMLIGFGAVGAAVRRRNVKTTVSFA